ncbi:hypothetical protein [Amedibacillus sp. YH-ame10]
MIRSYVKAIICKKDPTVKHEYSEILDLKIAEAIEKIQMEGGTIKHFVLIPCDMICRHCVFNVMYEDNGNFQSIDNLLRNEIFNFDQLK